MQSIVVMKITTMTSLKKKKALLTLMTLKPRIRMKVLIILACGAVPDKKKMSYLNRLRNRVRRSVRRIRKGKTTPGMSP